MFLPLPSGQGFAFNRKEKVRHEYNKLLRKEKKKSTPGSKVLYKDEYPEHLRHLYMAEAEKLRSEARTNRMNRSKLRMRGQEKGENDDAASQSDAAGPEVADGSELTESVAEDTEPAAASEEERCVKT